MKTIAAIATGLTPSGIGIVRISGPESYEVIRRIFRSGKRTGTVAAGHKTAAATDDSRLFEELVYDTAAEITSSARAGVGAAASAPAAAAKTAEVTTSGRAGVGAAASAPAAAAKTAAVTTSARAGVGAAANAAAATAKAAAEVTTSARAGVGAGVAASTAAAAAADAATADEIAAFAAVPVPDQEDLFSAPNRIHYGMIVSRETFVDEVLVMNMKAPHSYTGEDTIEIDCHGGPLMMRRILQAVLDCGADVRLAEPGEFTKRAFLNGRIDLSQAESVIDIINASNENSQKAALAQLRGSVSQAVKLLRDRLLRQSAFIEAALDDPEHYVLDEDSREALREDLESVLERTEELIRTYHYGKIVKEGINTCILGKPNAGKSSLLNALLGEERAIVTEVPGTTRDVITESLVVGNLTLNIMDTAGIRKTGDLVESIGVRKAYEMAKRADLCLYVVDASGKPDEKDREIMDFIRENQLKTVVVINKTDLCIEDASSTAGFLNETGEVVRISAKTGEGIDELIRKICSLFDDGVLRINDQVVITNERHMTHLKDARSALKRVLSSVDDGLPEDFYTIDLMDAYHSLGLIIGEETEDDLCDRIFSEFCMGK